MFQRSRTLDNASFLNLLAPGPIEWIILSSRRHWKAQRSSIKTPRVTMMVIEDVSQPFSIPLNEKVYWAVDTSFWSRRGLPGKRRDDPYLVIKVNLYRRWLLTHLVKFLQEEEDAYALAKVHKGIARHHLGARALAKKILRAIHYWLYVVKMPKIMWRSETIFRGMGKSTRPTI